jgi:cellulase/cellobiase CelA1
VTITNRSTTTITGWTLGWTFPGNQQISNAWNATVTQSGQQVTARNVDHNRTLNANGGTAAFGFQATYSGTNANPATFTLNGTTCTAV